MYAGRHVESCQRDSPGKGIFQLSAHSVVQTSGFIPIHNDKQLSDFCQFTLSYELHSGLVPRHDKATDAMNLMQIVEQSSLLDVGMVVADQQNGRFSTVPLVEEVISSNPLTILSGYSSCRGSEMGYSF